MTKPSHVDSHARHIAQKAFEAAQARGTTTSIADLPLEQLASSEDLDLIRDCPSQQCEPVLRARIRQLEAGQH